MTVHLSDINYPYLGALCTGSSGLFVVQSFEGSLLLSWQKKEKKTRNNNNKKNAVMLEMWVSPKLWRWHRGTFVSLEPCNFVSLDSCTYCVVGCHLSCVWPFSGEYLMCLCVVGDHCLFCCFVCLPWCFRARSSSVFCSFGFSVLRFYFSLLVFFSFIVPSFSFLFHCALRAHRYCCLTWICGMKWNMWDCLCQNFDSL